MPRGLRPALHRRLRRQRLGQRVRFDYVRFTPDSPLTTPRRRWSTHTCARPAGRRHGVGTARPSTWRWPSADDGECVSGVDKTEYSRRQRRVRPPTRHRSRSRRDGTHTIEYRSTDKAGNAETAKSVQGQARCHGAGDDGLGRADRGRPGDAHAHCERRRVGRRLDRVPRQWLLVRCGVHALRRAGGVGDLQRGEQAGLLGSGHVHGRVPLYGRRRQRRDAQDGDRHRRHGVGRRDGTGDRSGARSRAAWSRRDLLGCGDGAVLRTRRRTCEQRERRRERDSLDAGHGQRQGRRHRDVALRRQCGQRARPQAPGARWPTPRR